MKPFNTSYPGKMNYEKGESVLTPDGKGRMLTVNIWKRMYPVQIIGLPYPIWYKEDEIY